MFKCFDSATTPQRRRQWRAQRDPWLSADPLLIRSHLSPWPCQCPATGQTTASTTWVQNSINLLKHTHTHSHSGTAAAVMHMHVCVCMWAINFMSNQAGNQAAAAAAAAAPAPAAAANETATMPRKSHVDCPKPQPLKQMSTSFCICHLPHTPHATCRTHTHTDERVCLPQQYLKVPPSSTFSSSSRANQSKQLRSDFWLIVSPAHCLIIM